VLNERRRSWMMHLVTPAECKAHCLAFLPCWRTWRENIVGPPKISLEQFSVTPQSVSICLRRSIIGSRPLAQIGVVQPVDGLADLRITDDLMAALPGVAGAVAGRYRRLRGVIQPSGYRCSSTRFPVGSHRSWRHLMVIGSPVK
jgi:hypothetical protein